MRITIDPTELKPGDITKRNSNMKIRFMDEYGTAIEAELLEGRVRIITNADVLPQPSAVWLTRKMLRNLIGDLEILGTFLKEEQ